MLDPHALLLARAQVLGRDVQDAVGVDVELDFDLRNPRGAGGMPFQVELAEQPIVVGHFALALEDANRHRRLVVGRRAEGLLPLGRNRGVLLDEPRHHAAFGLDARATAE